MRGRRPTQLASDWNSINAAIVLVATGTSRRVTLANLRFGERLLSYAALAASEAGVSIALERGGADGPTALVVRPTA
jgi:hypothetical protein